MARDARVEHKRDAVRFWSASERYWEAAHGEKDPLLANPALQRLLAQIRRGDKVLDVGCGEGSKLVDIRRKVPLTDLYGIDISPLAIKKAKRLSKGKRIKYSCHDIERLPYKNDTFDVTYSTYTFEHTIEPQKILDEMIRVTRPGGSVMIVCPNFGSPLYPSPVTPRLSHAVRALKRDARYLWRKPAALEWYPETPVLTPDWQPDYDTTILPYVYSLKTLYPSAAASSTWKGMPAGDHRLVRVARLPFKWLGMLGVHPFRWWGSTLYFCYVKPGKAKKA